MVIVIDNTQKVKDKIYGVIVFIYFLIHCVLPIIDIIYYTFFFFIDFIVNLRRPDNYSLNFDQNGIANSIYPKCELHGFAS